MSLETDRYVSNAETSTRKWGIVSKSPSNAKLLSCDVVGGSKDTSVLTKKLEVSVKRWGYR